MTIKSVLSFFSSLYNIPLSSVLSHPSRSNLHLKDYIWFESSLENIEDMTLDTMSEGHKRLLYMMLTCHSNADLLLLDDPSAHLDVTNNQNLQNNIKLLRRKNCAGMIITYVTYFIFLIRDFISCHVFFW